VPDQEGSGPLLTRTTPIVAVRVSHERHEYPTQAVNGRESRTRSSKRRNRGKVKERRRELTDVHNTPLQQIAQICRETGKEYMVQVHSGEGLANHPGPEPCGGLREGTDEKSVGGHVGEVLRRGHCQVVGENIVTR
jgi:hypothetical protein